MATFRPMEKRTHDIEMSMFFCCLYNDCFMDFFINLTFFIIFIVFIIDSVYKLVYNHK